MKYLSAALLAVSLGLGLTHTQAAAQPTQAEPLSVLLHPNGALVQEEVRITPAKNGKSLTFTLPSAADPQSLDISVPGHDVASIRLVEVVAGKPGPSSTAFALQTRLEEVSRGIADAENARKDMEARQNFWRYPPIVIDNPATLTTLDKVLTEHQNQFAQAGADLAARIVSLRDEAKLLREQLDQAGQKPVELQAVLELAEASSGPLAVRYSYTLQNAGWRPVYRIEALPEQGKVKLTLEAELWQQSGADWSKTPLVLSTANPQQSMTPPSLFEWIIRPISPQSTQPSLRSSAAPMMNEAMLSKGMGMQGAAIAPRYEEGRTFQNWNLGRRALPAGPSTRLALERHTLDADFIYMLRPARAESAFLSAELAMPESRHFPAGDAQFLVEGVPVAKSFFAPGPDDRRIYFGIDPLVSAVMKKDGQQSGTQGLIDRKQNYNWNWTINVFNKHTRPIKVRVEEPAPQTRDQHIEVSIKSQPEATQEDQSLIWTLDIPAGQSSTIRHGVSFTAPTDMQVKEGR